MQNKHPKRWRWILLLSGAGLLLVSGIYVVFFTRGERQPVETGEYALTRLPVSDLPANTGSVRLTKSLQVNGELQVADSVVLSPTAAPTNPVIGQMYLDQDTNQMMYYNGQQFVSMGGNVTNVTNNVGGATTNNFFTTSGGSSAAVALQNATPGTPQSGGFNVAGTGIVGLLRTSTIQNSGNVSVSTDAGGGVTGNISITTGNSSATASGDITIDAGSGIVDGEVVGTKDFESGLDNMVAWFGSIVTQTTEQAHTGTHSLKMEATAPFWGVQENINLPITPVVPGHQYHFSMWVRAGSTSRSIDSNAVWVGGGGTALHLQTVNDTSSGWTEITGLGVAPGGATGVYPTFQSTGVVGEVHYFDSIVITDLSSASAASSIKIGATNAKIVTIGNLNQIGPTSIYGGSGINLQSGAGNFTVSSGAMNVTASSASSIATTAGGLTITSAASALWSVGQASAGVGGNLTLRAGNGGTDDNNNGGDLILQGGDANGTGTDGRVIVKPQFDSTDIFQIQNSAGSGFLLADSTNKRVTVIGTDASYASLTITDAHFKSTQTTAPTISTPTNCGTSPSATVTAGSTDSAGSFTITTGTGGTSSTCDTTITFRRPYGAAPKSIIVIGKTDAASAQRQIYATNPTTTSFGIAFATSAGGANSTPYSFNYWIVE